MIQDTLADIFLWFNQEIIVIPLIGVGYWAYRRNLFSHILFLILLSMIVNTFLKCLFQVPLKPHLNQNGWYAFPSGHMQFSTVLYGPLWWEFRKTKWAYSFPLLLLGMGWGMIWKQYHDFIDVGAGFITGIVLCLVYALFIKLPLVRHHHDKIGFFLLPFTAFLMFLMPSIPQHMAHMWQAQGGLLGFSFGLSLWSMRKQPLILNPSLKIRIAKSLLGLGVFSGLWFFNQMVFGGLVYPFYPFLSFFICGAWLSMGPDFLIQMAEKIGVLSAKKG